VTLVDEVLLELIDFSPVLCFFLGEPIVFPSLSCPTETLVVSLIPDEC